MSPVPFIGQLTSHPKPTPSSTWHHPRNMHMNQKKTPIAPCMAPLPTTWSLYRPQIPTGACLTMGAIKLAWTTGEHLDQHRSDGRVWAGSSAGGRHDGSGLGAHHVAWPARSGSERVHRYYTPQTMAMFHEKYDDAPLNPLLNEGILHGVWASGHPYSPRDRILYIFLGVP